MSHADVTSPHLRAVCYVRVSTSQQTEQGVSLEFQAHRCRAYCEAKGWTVEGVFEDAGESASSLRRPALEQLRDACHADQVDAVVIFRLDRLSRRVKDLADLLEEFERSRGVREGIQKFNVAVREPCSCVLSQGRGENIERVRCDEIIGVEPEDEIAAGVLEGRVAGVGLSSPGNLRAAIEAMDAEGSADCVAVRVDSLTDTGIGEQALAIRAFLREKGRYRYPIHNQLYGVRKPMGSTAVIESSYRGTMEQKARRTIRILEKMVEEEPENPHGPYFLCKTYRALGEAEGMLKWGRRCQELVPDEVRYASLWVWLFHAVMAVEGFDAAEEVLGEARRRHSGFADLEHCALALAAYRWQAAAR